MKHIDKFVLAVLVLAGSANSQAAEPPWESPHQTPPVVTAAPASDGWWTPTTRRAFLVSAVALFGAGTLPPRSSCTWCSTNGPDRFFRNHLRAGADGGLTYRNARSLSNAALGFSMLGSYALLRAAAHDEKANHGSDFAIWLQAISVTELLSSATKVAVARQRPCAPSKTCGSSPGSTTPGDNASFFSAHTSGSFAAVFAAGRIAKGRGYPAWRRILIAGTPMALACGLGRVAGDKHYVSDVIAGAAAGAALGWHLPHWTNKAALRKLDILVMPSVTKRGVSLSAQVEF